MFVPHHHKIASDSAATPQRWMLMLHGIYGSGMNWRTLARGICQRLPSWGVVLVDLRMHGQSQDAPPPHTVESAAEDLRHLAAHLGRQDMSIRAVCGHSFGGKVALAYRGSAGAELMQTWLLDSSPGARPDSMAHPGNTVVQVLELLKRLPPSFASREAFVQHVQQNGFAALLGHWLAMNLDRRGERYESRLDPDAMESLLDSYYRLNAWPWVAAGPGSLDVVVAGRSDAVSPADRERFAQLAAQGAPIQVTELPQAGHWVNVDAPERLLEIMTARLPG